MIRNIRSIWDDLKGEAEAGHDPSLRLYRALGESAIGVRAGFIPRDQILELLIEVPAKRQESRPLPEWRGMRFEYVPIKLPPRQDARQLRLYLVDLEHKDIFITFCEDLVDTLEGISDVELRALQIEECLTRWSRFFKKSGHAGLPPSFQRGLFAELTWLEMMLTRGSDLIAAISSWKGCERGYHDFDVSGDIIEVKSTMTREPRSVRINNERQLDDRGLISLHLFVLTLQQTEGGGMTLPEKVTEIREELQGTPAAASRFERCLVSAGYLNQHEKRYPIHYIVRHQELFHISQGFPRIIDPPKGVGDLKYSISVSACQNYEIDLHAYLAKLIGRHDA